MINRFAFELFPIYIFYSTNMLVLFNHGTMEILYIHVKFRSQVESKMNCKKTLITLA